jgi:hypothetical protein
LNRASGIAVDVIENVYVADTYNNRALKLAANGQVPTELPFTGLNNPFDVAVDTEGNVYVADTYNDRALKLAAGAQTAEELPFVGLRGPNAIAVDAGGAVFTTSYGDGRVLKLSAGATNPTALSFMGLVKPWGVSVDGVGTAGVASPDGVPKTTLRPFSASRSSFEAIAGGITTVMPETRIALNRMCTRRLPGSNCDHCAELAPN